MGAPSEDQLPKVLLCTNDGRCGDGGISCNIFRDILDAMFQILREVLVIIKDFLSKLSEISNIR